MFFQSQVCNPEDYVEEEPMGEEAEPGKESDSMKEVDPRTERWTDVNPIACDCCSKVWNSKKQLWQHLIRSHIYESMHTCGICLRVCKNYYDLAYHLDAQHSNSMNDHVVRFACYVCGHYHNSQSKLDKHFVVHKNPPPQCEYTCQYCQRVYRSVVYYREHTRMHEARTADKTAAAPKKEQSEFSGFSINSILETGDEHEDDIELEMQKSVEDEDLVELDEDDSDSDDNSNSGELCDDNVFRGYEAGYNQAQTSGQKQASQLNNVVKDEKFAFASMPAYFKAKEENMEDDIDLESNISCSSVNSASELQEEDEDEESVLNGKQEESSDEQPRAYSSVNNNQKQDRKVPRFDEKRNFHNSNGENYFRRMTEDI